jgi:hypothetical protein
MSSSKGEVKAIDRSVLVAGAAALDLFARNDLNSKTMGEVREMAFAILPPEKLKEVIEYANAPHGYKINEDV